MKKLKRLLEKKEKLELKVAELFSKFTETTGIIIKSTEVHLNTEQDTKIVYNVEVNGEI